MHFYSFLLVGAVGLLNACNGSPGTPPGPSASPTASVSASPAPSVSSPPVLVAPAGKVNILAGARCEMGSLWIVPEGEEIAVPPCPPPESQPAYVQPAATVQIDAEQHAALAERLGFLAVRSAPERLGSLTPATALADGLKGQCQPEEGVVFHGGRLGGCSQYLRQTSSGEVAIVANKTEMRAIFAPIEGGAEAASYALALSGGEWRSAFSELTPDFRFYTRTLLRSRVDVVAGGYEVLLYQPQRFGCGPHPVSAVTYFVSDSGDFQERRREQVWANPALDGLCVD